MQKLINRKSLNSNEMSMIGYIETDDKNPSPQEETEAARRMNKMKGVSLSITLLLKRVAT
jgi:hypothetical protein